MPGSGAGYPLFSVGFAPLFCPSFGLETSQVIGVVIDV